MINWEKGFAWVDGGLVAVEGESGDSGCRDFAGGADAFDELFALFGEGAEIVLNYSCSPAAAKQAAIRWGPIK